MNCKQCGKCGAKWLQQESGGEFQLYWATGAAGKEEDLAGLVCNNLGDHQCINPKRGDDSGDSWAKREEYAAKEMERQSRPHPDEM